MTLTDTLAAIDALTTACAQCNGPRDNSPSDDFCSESCQARWLRSRSADPARVLGPDFASPRVTIRADLSGFIEAMAEMQRGPK